VNRMSTGDGSASADRGVVIIDHDIRIGRVAAVRIGLCAGQPPKFDSLITLIMH